MTLYLVFLMLIQFAVKNYRSIKEEQTLSLVRSSSQEMSDNYFDSQALATPILLNAAVIYGANASGKSNVIKALDSMIRIIADSFNKKPNESIDVEPFLLDVISQKSATSYDVNFIVNLMNEQGEKHTVRVNYGFIADKSKVYEEWLSVYPKGKEQNWFHRKYDEESSTYQWKMSPYFKGEKISWQKQTRNNQLFLSTATHLNSEQIRPIYRALTEDTYIVRTDRISNHLSKEICKTSDSDKEIFIGLLQSAGIEVNDIIFKKPEIKFAQISEEIPVALREKIIQELQEDFIAQNETFFVYKDNFGQPQEINLRDESDGTQKLFEFAGLILAVLHSGKTLIIDELNKSLHPDLVRFLVQLFNSGLNKKHAQLIFTTHETSVLRKDLLRRDQIWFCEKQQDRSTILYPLTDFKPHIRREDIEEYYLHGKYGAKPMIQEFYLPDSFWQNEE